MPFSFDSLPKNFDSARALLVPRVVGTSQRAVDHLVLLNQGAEGGLQAVRPVNGTLSIGAALSLTDGFAHVSRSNLDEWGVSLNVVVAAAVENSLGRDLEISRIGEGTFLIRDSDFAASVWEKPALAALPVKGAPVVVAATRAITLIAGSEDAGSLLVLAATLEQILASGDRVESVTPFTHNGTSWEAVTWSGAAVTNGTVDTVQRMFAASVYSRQRMALTEYYEAQGTALNIAEYQVFTNHEGQPRAITTWTEGVPTALPAVDEVLLVGDGGEVVGIPWIVAVERFGEHLVSLKTIPERYFARSFPSADEIRAAKNLG